MAVNNRTEAITEVNTKIVPTVTNATHRDLLNNDIINSIVFRKDIIEAETPIGGAVTIDYVDKDTATTTITVNTTVSFTNIENGDVKYLHITKAATNTVSFAGATDVTNFSKYIDSISTVITYAVYNKNGTIYVLALTETIIEAVKADITSGDALKFTTAEAVNDYLTDYIPITSSETLTITSNDGATITPAYSKLVKNGSLINIQSDIGWVYSGPVVNPVITTNIGADVGQTVNVLIDSVGVVSIGVVSADNPAQITINGTVQTADDIKIWGCLNT